MILRNCLSLNALIFKYIILILIEGSLIGRTKSVNLVPTVMAEVKHYFLRKISVLFYENIYKLIIFMVIYNLNSLKTYFQ